MPFICLFSCGAKPRKKVAPKRKTRMEDFRRADPTYTNFVPKTCRDAIDLFNRHRALGLQADLYPECFVHCAKQLPDEELDMFHRFIVCPTRDIQKGGEKPTLTDIELEKERLMLLKESEKRDKLCVVTEELSDLSLSTSTCPMSQVYVSTPPDQDDEKRPPSPEQPPIPIFDCPTPRVMEDSERTAPPCRKGP